jgi:hypothetical protein
MTPSVPRLWPDSTIVILGSGPSLTQADVDVCRGRVRVIAIKDAIRLAPWADVLYGCGADVTRWWNRMGDSVAWFQGLRYTLDPGAAKWATVLKNTGQTGLELSPDGLRTGENSGYQAINLAVHLGARQILLLGFDMGKSEDGKHHWFGDHPHGVPPPYEKFLWRFETIVEPLRAARVAVLNCSRTTALPVSIFPRVTLDVALDLVPA